MGNTGGGQGHIQQECTMKEIGISIVVGILIGLAVGWRVWHPEPRQAVIESAAPAAMLRNGVQEIARQPAAPIPEAITAAAKEINPKAKVSRAISFDVKPLPIGPKPTDAVPTANNNAVITPLECAPVHIDAGIVDLPDGSHRVVIKSNGELSNAIDIPGFLPPVVGDLKWAAGALYDVSGHSYGVFVDRDIRRLRIGVDMMKLSPDNTFKVIARIGGRF